MQLYAACEVSNCDVCDADTKICETCAKDYELSQNECSELAFNFQVFSFKVCRLNHACICKHVSVTFLSSRGLNPFTLKL